MHRLFYSPRLHPLIKFHCSTFINVPHFPCQGCSHKFLYSEQPPHVPAGYLFPEKDSAAARFPNFPLKNVSHLNCMRFLVYTITRHWVYNAYLEMASNQKYSNIKFIKKKKWTKLPKCKNIFYLQLQAICCIHFHQWLPALMVTVSQGTSSTLIHAKKKKKNP